MRLSDFDVLEAFMEKLIFLDKLKIESGFSAPTITSCPGKYFGLVVELEKAVVNGIRTPQLTGKNLSSEILVFKLRLSLELFDPSLCCRVWKSASLRR